MNLILLLAIAASQAGEPVWSVRIVNPRTIELTAEMPEDAGPAAFGRLVPAPGGRLPTVDIIELDTGAGHDPIPPAKSEAGEPGTTETQRIENRKLAIGNRWVGFGPVARAAGIELAPLVVHPVDEEGGMKGSSKFEVRSSKFGVRSSKVTCRRIEPEEQPQMGTDGHGWENRQSEIGNRRFTIRLSYDRPFSWGDERSVMARLVRSFLDGGVPDLTVLQPGYLIIVPDDFYDRILTLARWKERKGYKVWVKKLSETGSQADLIRNYIRTAYETWDPAPSYVLLVGAVNKIPAFHYSIPQHVTDHPFACVDGDDFLADLFVGRLPAANASELDVMVAKIVGYERTPYLADTTWYHRALAVGTTYQEGGTPALTALVTKRVIRERLLARGFSEVDTVFYPPTRYGRGPVDSAVNRGVLYINGRGWGNYDGWGYPQYLSNDVNALANGWKLPVVTSIYCGTGNYARNPCFGEVWLRAGTPTVPKGGVAFFGASWTGTSTRWNNCIDYGIYQAILDRGILACGPAMYAGKLALCENFPLAQDSFDLRAYFQVYNLLGDPSLAMWTTCPRPIAVSHPVSFPVGASSFDVLVRDGSSQPVKDAVVSLYKAGEVHVAGRTDEQGRVRFAIATSTADTMHVTVTGANLAPYLGTSIGQAAGVFVGYQSHAPATVAPGKHASLGVTLKNFGTSQTATGVQAVLRSRDTLSVVADSVRSFGDLAPGASQTAPAFVVRVAPGCTAKQTIAFELSVRSADSTWQSAFLLRAQGPTLTATRYTVHDANGWLDPGETAELSVTVLNRGDGPGSNLAGVLSSLNPAAIAVLDSFATFGTIAPGDSVSNAASRFRVRAAPGIGVGRRFTLRLVLSGDSARQAYDFPVTVGEPVPSSPLGPDQYGYYAYDDTDAGYPERPAFDWFEIDPAHGGSGTKLVLGNDQAKPVALPFTFRFYGQDYGSVSVCDNGYIAFDQNPQGEIYNWHIPYPAGPDGIIAVFWDDFRADTANASGVFTKYDAANHRFIVEWSRCVHVHGFRSPYLAEQQTFQAILHDPQYHQTRTGDGPILCQYLSVRNDDSLNQNCHNFCTAGIMSPDHASGLEYTYAGAYPAAAAPLAPGRAIRFTTNPPDTFVAVSEPGGPERMVNGEWRMTIVPNPAAGFATLCWDLPVDGPVGVEVLDIAGRVVLRQSAICNLQSAIPLDIRRLSSGVYLVRLSSLAREAETRTAKLTVRRKDR